MVKYHIDISIDCVHIRNGLQDYGIELNIRELDEVFSYFGKCVYCVGSVNDGIHVALLQALLYIVTFASE